MKPSMVLFSVRTDYIFLFAVYSKMKLETRISGEEIDHVLGNQ